MDFEKQLKEIGESITKAASTGLKEAKIAAAYQLAKDVYASIGIDTDEVLEKLGKIEISLHCWQGDDVVGFEQDTQAMSGGIMTTGNYPGKARNIEELWADLEKAMSQIPGKQKVNVHASYISSAEKPERDQITTENFQGWIDWAKKLGIGLDFNTTCFSHPLSADGFTLSSGDEKIRSFWIEHAKRVRRIAEDMGRQLGKTCVVNHWIPDGYKDNPVDRMAPRERLADSYDQIFAEKLDPRYIKDSLESKVFGIGSEAYVTGSHEFYMGYTLKNNLLMTLDTGHFHPTESVAAKISALLVFMPELLLHVSRPIRWDSDHVVIMDDELRATAQELVRCNALDRVYIALDYFDASINRLAAWIIGTRNTQKALLAAMLEPVEALKKAEAAGDLTSRLALTEEYKSYPVNAVWDYFCMKNNVGVRDEWLTDIKKYEAEVLSKR